MEKGIRNLIVVLIVALILRLGWIYAVSPKELSSDPLTYHNIAVGLLEKNEYRSGVKYAYMPPVYPIFIAGVYKIFGVNPEIVKHMQAALSVLSCVWIYLLARLLISPGAGLWAAGFFATYPQFIRYSGELWSETLFFFLFIPALIFLYKGLEKWPYHILAGVLLGLCGLIREIGFLFIVPVVIWLYFVLIKTKGLKYFLLSFTMIFLFMSAVIYPWAKRNYEIFNKFIPISTNGGINFYMGNNPDATGEFKWKLVPGTQWPDHVEGISEEEIKALELSTYEHGYKEGLKFIIDHPGQFLGLAFKKLYLYWAPPYFSLQLNEFSAETAFRILWILYDVALLCLAFVSILHGLSHEKEKWLLPFFWILMITAIGMMTYYSPRYRLAFVPVMILFAVASVDRMFLKKDEDHA